MDFCRFFGPWALVTGASSGIGRGFAQELARRGLNIVLVSRNQDALVSLAEELRTQYKVGTRVISMDLSDRDSVDAIFVRTADLDIGLLISNAGDSSIGKYLNESLENVRRNIQLNALAHADLAHYMGTRILDKRGGQGGLLLHSSIAAFQGMPYLASYSASKAFVLSLGEALHMEYQRSGMHVTVLTPGPVKTKLLAKSRKASEALGEMVALNDVRSVVIAGLKGIERNKMEVTPGIRAKLLFRLAGNHLLLRETRVRLWARMAKRYMGRVLPHLINMRRD